MGPGPPRSVLVDTDVALQGGTHGNLLCQPTVAPLLNMPMVQWPSRSTLSARRPH